MRYLLCNGSTHIVLLEFSYPDNTYCLGICGPDNLCSNHWHVMEKAIIASQFAKPAHASSINLKIVFTAIRNHHTVPEFSGIPRHPSSV